MSRVFSGIQPTGIPHLGNYLGALKQWTTMQDEHECYFCLVDLHAITMGWKPEELHENILQSAACLFALGIKPSYLYTQSSLSAHARLGWIMNCIVRLGWLNRMTQFKDKAGKNRENHSAGLYTYPSLMAADILAFKATNVPVGDDQRQHLELANDIAEKFNHDLVGGKEFFPNIKPIIPARSARVMSLRDGLKKMSKSDPSDQSRILLNDTDDAIALKIKRAKTDSGTLPDNEKELEGRPEAINLLGLYSTLSGKSMDETLAHFAGKGFGALKDDLTAVMIETVAPIRTRTTELLSDKDQLVKMLKDGHDRAAVVADATVKEAEKLCGFVQF